MMKNLKKFLLFIPFLLLIAGCSTKINDNGVLRLSQPVFIETTPKDRKAYVKFTSASLGDSNLTAHVAKSLARDGFRLVGDEEEASIIIKGNLNFFRKRSVREPYYSHARLGYWGGYRGYWGGYFGGYWDDYYIRYVYDAQISLLIKIDDGVKVERYATNLDYQSGRNSISAENIKEILNERVYRQILAFLRQNSKQDLTKDEIK